MLPILCSCSVYSSRQEINKKTFASTNLFSLSEDVKICHECELNVPQSHVKKHVYTSNPWEKHGTLDWHLSLRNRTVNTILTTSSVPVCISYVANLCRCSRRYRSYETKIILCLKIAVNLKHLTNQLHYHSMILIIMISFLLVFSINSRS